MATIKEVATRAGVGIGTVSRVLNDSGPVSSTTRERVLEAISALDFQPNRAARQLATAQTHTIGVVLPFLTRPFFVSVLHGIEAVVAQTHYNLHICNVETVEKRDEYFATVLFRGRLDGVLIVSLPLDDVYATRLQAAQVATVLIESRHDAFTSVGVHSAAGAQQATEHLIALGHQRIAYISGLAQTELGFRNNVERLHGYQTTLQQHGIDVEPVYILMNGDGPEMGMHMAQQLLNLDQPPTAIFAASDELALGVLQAAQGRGLRIPDDLAIVGYDDIELAAYIGLTTVRQPMTEMGRLGVEQLLQQLNGAPAAPKQITLPVELVVRASTVG
jgi:DNA-binding LacI/PurR family transcriptional regulator